MNLQLFFISLTVILPLIKGSPLNTDETFKSASPGQIVELILNVVNFANDVKKKLTEPSTVINIRKAVDRPKRTVEDGRFERLPRDLMTFGFGDDASKKMEENGGGKMLLERMVGWVIQLVGGERPKIGDVRDCIREKEQELVNVATDVRGELQRCFDVSRSSDEVQQVKQTSGGQRKDLRDDVGEGSLAVKEGEEGEILLVYEGDDSVKDEYDESMEALLKALLIGQKGNIDDDFEGGMLRMDKDQKKKDQTSSEGTVDSGIEGKSGSNVTSVLGDGKKASVDMEDSLKIFRRSPEENVQQVGVERNVTDSRDLEVDMVEGVAGERTKGGGRTPKETHKEGVEGVAVPLAPVEDEPSVSQSSTLNVTCVATTIQTGRQKIENIASQINNCFVH